MEGNKCTELGDGVARLRRLQGPLRGTGPSAKKGKAMRIEHINEFIVLAHYANYTAAAKALYISQPTLSSHIAGLEKELGAPLFERSSSQVKLTPVGREFLKGSNDIIARYDAMIRSINKLKRRQSVTVRMATFTDHRLVSQILRIMRQDLIKHHPDIELEVVDVVMSDPLKDILEGRLDLAFILDDYGELPPGLAAETIQSDPLVGIVSKQSPLAQRESLSLADLQGTRALVPGLVNNHWMIDSTEKLLEDNGVYVDLTERYFDSIADLYDLDFQEGIYLDSTNAAASLSPAKLRDYRVLPFEEGLAFADVAVYDPQKESPAIRTVIQVLKQSTQLLNESEKTLRGEVAESNEK